MELAIVCVVGGGLSEPRGWVELRSWLSWVNTSRHVATTHRRRRKKERTSQTEQVIKNFYTAECCTFKQTMNGVRWQTRWGNSINV